MAQLYSILALLAVAAAPSAPSGVPEVRDDAVLEVAEPPGAFVTFRIGAAATDADTPYLCVELVPFGLVGVEGCGTGAGFLSRAVDHDIAHFRAKARVGTWHTAIGWLTPQLFAGFAELELGEDAPGLDFGGTGPGGNETAGAEAGASARWSERLADGFELLLELEVGVMFFPAAPELLLPQPSWQPILNLTAGVGW